MPKNGILTQAGVTNKERKVPFQNLKSHVSNVKADSSTTDT